MEGKGKFQKLKGKTQKKKGEFTGDGTKVIAP